MPFTPISWPVESTLQLCSVPWDGNYRDCVRFPSEAARTAYFNGLAGESVKLDKMTFLKPGEPIMVNVPYSRAYTMNYCVVKNPELPVPGEVTPPTLYYFVTSVAYVAPNTTALTVELDVWQTYIFGVHFGRCFLERGHWAAARGFYYARYSSGEFAPSGLQAYSTVAESLDIGSEYRIVKQEWHTLEDGSSNPWAIIIATTTDLTANWGTMDAPSLSTAQGGDYDGVVGGMSYFAVDGADADRLFRDLRNAPWVSKGILSVTLYPKRSLPEWHLDATIGTVRCMTLHNQINTPSTTFFKETPMGDIMDRLPDRYGWLVKFATYPYSVIELTAYNGANVLYKPELFDHPTVWFNLAGTFPAPFTRVCVYPDFYGRATVSEVSQERTYHDSANRQRNRLTMQGNGFDSALWISDFPQFPLTNDSYINYMASTINTRLYQYNSAGWGLAKSNTYADLALSNTQASLDTAQRNKDIQNVQDAANMAVGAIGAIADMNYGGAVAGLVSGGVNLVGGNMQFQNNQALQQGIATANYETAQYANQGDYENAIAAINAAVQDAALMPPSVVGQQGGNGFNIANGLFGVEYRLKMPDESHIREVGEYWLRYGYAFNAFMQPPQNLRSMTNATYWKVKECYLDSAQADEGAKQVIRGIMEKGVTVYNDPADIGRLDFADNKPL